MPKLKLRDLFAVVTIVALALGWAVDHWRLAIDNRRLDDHLRERGLLPFVTDTDIARDYRDVAESLANENASLAVELAERDELIDALRRQIAERDQSSRPK